MNKKKLILGALLAAGITTAAGAAGFEKTNTYADGQFTDVPAAEWYAKEVQSTYELGLMNGVGGNLFSPNGEVTVAEAITMAARAASIYAGETIPTSDGEWYQMYVNYAVSKGFVKDGQFDSFNRPAKRYEVALLFENAMPDGFFAAKNDVSDIPDVSEVWDYHDAILGLYKAGVVMGSDSYGNFKPENNITRAEAAAIINRVALPENRLSKTLDKISADDAYPLSLTNSYGANKEGLMSGWLYDGRGSTPRTSLFDSHGTIIDISEENGSAYIREFNKTSTGKILVQTRASIGGYDGVYMEFQNDTGDSVFRLQTMDGDWKMLGADGNYTTIYDIGESERSFVFEMELDLDNNRITVYINYKLCGTYPLATSGEKTNILNFRYATTEEGTPSVSPGAVHMHGNYAVIEYFSFNDGNKLPIGWTGDKVFDTGNVLYVGQNGYASKAFNPVSDTVIAEAMFLLPESESVTYALKSGSKTIAAFKSDAESFYVNGEKVYENYYANLWYRLRFEANTDTQTVLVKINGKNVAELPFAEAATSADNVYLSNDSATEARFDDIKVYRTYERDDYVPAPVVPKGEEDYIVGMNVCSLWQNENHFGWHCITPYDDPQPVLGYYDEGLAETADWELKYIIEHGIDFQAFCIYANSTNGPQRYGATHLYDGFMNAKYSDMSKFCVIWETANAQSPSSMEAWKEHYVPYFIEYYFKDPRHIVIDNKPVLCVFGAGKIPERLGGSNADVKAMFDYLEEEVRKIGFDGMIYLACGSSSASLAEMGFDGCYAYNWGNYGYQYATNVNSITGSAKQGHLYTVPTISVGFNSIPWHGIRYPMMTKEDFAKAQEWVKTEYLTTYPKETWQEKFVMLSTWNEYGEGTYMMPTNDEKGFQYLDVLREAYTDEKEDSSINTVPTEEQLYRINRLYPQYRRLLRKEGYYEDTINTDELTSIYTIDYSTRENVSVWTVKSPVTDENGISGITGSDAIIQINDIGESVSLAEAVGFKIKTKFPKETQMQVFFTSTESSSWTEGKAKTVVSTSDEMTEYTVFFNEKAEWKGELLGIRIDPVTIAEQPFTLKSVEILAAPKNAPKEMIINGQKFETNFRHETAENGDILVAFDPAVGMDFRLNIFHIWDKSKGELTLNFAKNVMVFTVGSDKYTADGTEKSLGYALKELDGLPMLPMNVICDAVGYTMSITADGCVSIDTDQKKYFDQMGEREFGKWEFEFPGDTESWSSSFMSLLVNDGYMAAESTSTSNDPTILLNVDDFSMIAKKFKAIEYKVRYKYNSDNNQQLTMYFITDKDGSWSESKTLKIPLNGKDSGGEWETYSLDITNLAQWKDTITDLRFDPFNATGTIDIDYIRFIPDENYADLTEEEMPFSIVNGDAEQTSNVSFGGTKIVKDPENENNNCFVALGNQGAEGKKEWIYSTQTVRFKPGATYKVECDVRLAQHGGKDITSADFKATILSNARYADPSQTSYDHIVARKTLTAADGWVHFSFEFTVSADSRARGNDQFTFYSDPVNDLGVGYYFDNVVVTEVLPE